MEALQFYGCIPSGVHISNCTFSNDASGIVTLIPSDGSAPTRIAACPSCGNAATVIFRNKNAMRVSCGRCRITGPLRSNYLDAIVDWNRREGIQPELPAQDLRFIGDGGTVTVSQPDDAPKRRYTLKPKRWNFRGLAIGLTIGSVISIIRGIHDHALGRAAGSIGLSWLFGMTIYAFITEVISTIRWTKARNQTP